VTSRIHVLIEGLGDVEPNMTASLTSESESGDTVRLIERRRDLDDAVKGDPIVIAAGRAIAPDLGLSQGLHKRFYPWVRGFLRGHK
jgi:hypothetical protein